MRPSQFLALICYLPLFVHSASFSTTTDGFRCSDVCSDENSILNLGVLRSHRYQFQISHTINSPIQEDSMRSLSISGEAVISGGVNCTYELLLENVKVLEIDEKGVETDKKEITKLLEDNRAFFGFDDGAVTGYCPSKSEKPFSWNVKAAIISHLQANFKSSSLPSETIEEDISGTCLTRYDIIEKNEEVLTFTKRKSTAGCGNKYGLLSHYNGILDQTPSTSSKQLMVSGEQECRVSLNLNKPLSESSCEETFIINDYFVNRWKMLNLIKVKTSLKLISSSSSGSIDIRPENYIRTNLRYHESFISSLENRETSLNELVEELKGISTENQVPNTDFFNRLVNAMHGFTSDDFEALKKLYNNENIKTLLFDAAVETRTESAMNFIEWCLENGEIQLSVRQLSSVIRPSLKYILAAQKVLKKTDSMTAKLILSNLLKSYCDENSRCTDDADVIKIMETFEESILTSCKYSDRREIDEILASLRAIGNLGRVSNKSRVFPALARCLNPSDNRDLYVRIAAAEAFRNFPLDEEADEILFKILGNKKLDTGLRIQAFRSFARRLTKQKLVKMRSVLLERYDDLTSYAQRYFNEHAISQDPSRQDEVLLLRHMIEPWWPKGPSNIFYFEKFFMLRGIGTSVESSIIYGKDYVQNANFKLNMNVLGYSFNLLELGGWNFPTDGYKPRDKWETFFSNRTIMSLRSFNRDIGYFDKNISLQSVLSTQPHFIRTKHILTLPTIGGILLQVTDSISASESSQYHDGSDSNYGIDIALKATRIINVGFNVNQKLLGYSTKDNIEIKLPLVATFDTLSGGFEVGLLGSESPFKAFKTSRMVKSITSYGESDLITSPGIQEILGSSPSILKLLIGLDANLATYKDLNSGLTMGYELQVKSFEGLFIGYNFENAFMSKSMRLEVKRYTTNVLESKELINFHIQRREVNDEWSTAANLKLPWDSIYGFSVNGKGSGEFAGKVNFGTWEASLSGNVQSTGLNDYEVSAQMVHPDYSLSLNQQKFGNRYVLAAESASPLLPFILKASTDFAGWRGLNHQSELRLPKLKNTFKFDTNLNWHRRYSIEKLRFKANDDKLNQSWLGEFVAVNNIGRGRDMQKPLGYQYSILIETKENDQMNTWTLGSLAIVNSTNSDIWDANVKNWIQGNSADFRLSCNQLPSNMNERTCEFIADVKRDNAMMFDGKGTLNLDGPDFSNGTFNASFQHPLVCQGDPGNLRIHLFNQKGIRTLEGEILWGNFLKYGFNNSFDPFKRISDFYLTDFNGFEFRIESPYTIERTAKLIQTTTVSSVYFGKINTHTIYQNLSFGAKTLANQFRIERTSDGVLIGTFDFSTILKKLFNININLPLVRNGFQFDIGLNVDSIYYSELSSKFLLLMNSRKRGYDFSFTKGVSSVLPIELSASLYGFDSNRPLIIKANARSSDASIVESNLSVKTQEEDEFTLKFTKMEEKKANGGELSLLCSISPGTPRPYFTGFLYKTQLSWIFTPTLLKIEQQGEWNGNKATPPGMPFRYGIQVSLPKLKSTENEIQIFAEDTNMGKVFGFEMIEALIRNEIEAKKGAFESESNILLNWRTYLGRGVVGSQATLKLQMDSSMTDGNMELNWVLPDANQTEVVAEIDFKIEEEKLSINSKANLGDKQIHEGFLGVKQRESYLDIDFNAKVNDYSVDFGFEGDLTSTMSVDVEVQAKQEEKEIANFKLIATQEKLPKLKIFFVPGGNLISIDTEIGSKTQLINTSTVNFDIEGYFKTQPVFFNSDFVLRVTNQRLVETKLTIEQTNGITHKEVSKFEMSENGKYLAVDLNIDSPLIVNGPLKISTKQGSTAQSDVEYDYDSQYVDKNKFSMNLKSKKETNRSFEDLTVIVDQKSLNRTYINVKADNKEVLCFDSRDGDFSFVLKLADKTIVKLLIWKELVIRDDGYMVNFRGGLYNEDNSIDAKLKVSNLPNSREIDVTLSTSGDLGKHDFALAANIGFLLDLLTKSNSKDASFGLKKYLYHFDDHTFGVEFSSENLMITSSLNIKNAPLKIRLALGKSELNTYKGLVQVDGPFNIDARGLCDLDGEIYLALSNKADISNSVVNTNVAQLLGGSKRRFINNGCGNQLSECVSIILGSASISNNPFQFVFSIIIPIFGNVDSLVFGTEFSGFNPRFAFIMTKDREVGFGVQTDISNGIFTVETAWNRRKGGVLMVEVGRKKIVIESLTNRFEMSRDGDSYIIANTDLLNGKKDIYLHLTTLNPNEFEVNSYLLKNPIVFVSNKNGNEKNLRLYHGTLKDLSTLLFELSIRVESTGCKRKSLINLRRNGKSVAIDSESNMCQYATILSSNISIDEENGKIYFEREPSRRIFINVNENIIFEISKERHLNGRIGRADLQYRKGTSKMEAEFRTSYEPMQLFASLKTSEGEAVVEGNMTSLLNVFGRLWHSPDEGEKVLDVEISTEFDELDSVYSFNGFWRLGFVYEAVVNGLKNTVSNTIPYLLTDVEDTIMSFLVDGMNELSDLFDMARVKSTLNGIRKQLQTLAYSFGGPPLDDKEFFKSTLAQEFEKIYDSMIDLITRIQNKIMNLDARGLYNSESVGKMLAQVEAFSRNSYNVTSDVLTKTVSIINAITDYSYHVKSSVINGFKSILFNDFIQKFFDQFAKTNEEAQRIRGALSRLTFEVETTVKIIYEKYLAAKKPFLESLYRSLDAETLSKELLTNKLKADLNKITINGTILIPLWIRELASVPAAYFLSCPLTNNPNDQYLVDAENFGRFIVHHLKRPLKHHSSRHNNIYVGERKP